jgi:hypothetical protein
MPLKSQLTLEATGQFLGMPLVGAHDNAQPVQLAVERCIAQLARIAGH